MSTAYVDANVIIRLVTGDPPEMADAVTRLFERVDHGEVELIVDSVILAETVWVLSSFYGFLPSQIAPLLQSFLASNGIICDDKIELLQALALYDDRNIDFVDALLAIKMIKQEVDTVYSFDKHFDRLESIKRVTPE